MTNIENHVTTLETSKRLKELGVPQNSMFWLWKANIKGAKWEVKSFNTGTKCEYISAYLSSELGALLPDTVNGKLNEEIFGENGKTHNVQYDFWDEPTGHNYGIERKYRCAVGSKQFVAASEAECRGLMLCYLLEEEVIKL